MKKKIIFIIIICIILLVVFINSCKENKSYYIKEVNNNFGIEIPNRFTILKHRTPFSLHDYTNEFDLQFEKKDFDSIINRIDTNIFVKEINDDQIYIKKTISNREFYSIIFFTKDNTIRYLYSSN